MLYVTFCNVDISDVTDEVDGGVCGLPVMLYVTFCNVDISDVTDEVD